MTQRSFDAFLRREVPVEYLELPSVFLGSTTPYAEYIASACHDKFTQKFREGCRIIPSPPRKEDLEGTPWETNLSYFGKQVKEVINERLFIDLGCGPGGSIITLGDMLSAFGAIGYVGVDAGRDSFEGETVKKGINTCFYKEDMLRFIARIEGLESAVFHLSAIDPPFDEPGEYGTPDYVGFFNTVKYIKFLFAEMGRVCNRGGAVILGPLTFGRIDIHDVYSKNGFEHVSSGTGPHGGYNLLIKR